MNLKEIAVLAGVSPAAVSRYLNGGSLSEEKREQIRRVIEQTDYRPNRLAHDLRKGRVRQVGVIVPKIHSASVSEVLAGINAVLAEQGYMTLLCCTDGDDALEEKYLLQLQSYQLAGFIVMGTSVSEEKERLYRSMDAPLVVTGQCCRSLDCVYHDDEHAMAALAEKMLEAGRRRFAYIGVHEKDPAVGLARRRGAFETLERAGVPTAEIPTAFADFTVADGYRKMQTLLADGARPDGVLCATASIAHGAMVALKEAGFRIPADVSVAGIGNDEANRISTPELTTVRLYQTECGQEAARMLLKRIEGETTDPEPQKTMMGYTLIERGSI